LPFGGGGRPWGLSREKKINTERCGVSGR
jgi:hypothetical protein